jgi:hypothetical protein
VIGIGRFELFVAGGAMAMLKADDGDDLLPQLGDIDVSMWVERALCLGGINALVLKWRWYAASESAIALHTLADYINHREGVVLY